MHTCMCVICCSQEMNKECDLDEDGSRTVQVSAAMQLMVKREKDEQDMFRTSFGKGEISKTFLPVRSIKEGHVFI